MTLQATHAPLAAQIGLAFEERSTLTPANAPPDVVEAVRAAGGEVTTAREARPSFDDVFAILVERDRAEHAPEGSEAAA